MKKYYIITTAAICLLHSFVFSQKTGSVAKPKSTSRTVVNQRSATPPVKQIRIQDTLAYNIQSTINELNAYITDNSLPVQLITGSYAGDDLSRPFYTSLVKIPGSAENTIGIQSVDRYRGIERWLWKSVVLRAPKDQLPVETFVSLKLKIDSIIKAMPAVKESDEKNHIFRVEVYENVSHTAYRNLYSADEVGILLQFLKPLSQTEQQALDSLIKIYRPGLQNVNTAHDAADKFTRALNAEGFSEEKSINIFADEVKVVADKDIKAAFQMLMGTYLDATKLKAGLTEGQRSEIRRLATELVNAYNAKWDPPHPAPAPTSQGSGSSTYTGTQQVTQRQGKRVKCGVCNGAGQYEKLTYSHTYNGIYNNVDTRVYKWVVCDVCNGSGWVTKYKN